MPRYDYRCNVCGHQYEKREGFNAPSVQECPVCQGEARRVLTPPAIVFKGSGWYVTDSRKSGAGTDRGEPAAASSEAAKPAESGAPAASDSSSSSTSSAAPAAAAD
ncbi:MAG TPA: FmdB family zinc ribbon protein [Dehalococcoidia bacterium]|nr:FmdB family zinc ribbon protein [Dehalococcoidia bacterium]